MKSQLFCLVVILILLPCYVQALGYGWLTTNNYRYFWRREMNDSSIVQQSAISIASGSRVLIQTLVRQSWWWFNFGNNIIDSDGHNVVGSQTMLDFSTTPCVAAVKIEQDCYLVNCPEDFNTVVAELNTRNGATVTSPMADVLLDATNSGARLTFSERRALMHTNPGIFNLCRFYSNYIYDTVPADAATFPDGTVGSTAIGEKVVSTVTYNSMLRILTPTDDYYR